MIDDSSFRLLCKESDDIASETPGGVCLDIFRGILLKHKDRLGIKVAGCRWGNETLRGVAQTLPQILEHKDGVALVSSGKGHCIGVSCREGIAVDSTGAYPVDLLCPSADDALAMLGDLLGVDRHRRATARLCVLYISFHTEF
jgi:hypothetical protein